MERETPATAADLLAELENVDRYVDLRAYTSQAPSRLEVVAAPDDPGIATAPGGAEYARLLDLLCHHHQIILVDCGTGILDSATCGIVEAADQLVVVTGASLDEARATSFMLDWLEAHGHGPMVERSVAVVDAVRWNGGRIDLDELRAHFSARWRRTVTVPWDRSLAAGGVTGLDALSEATGEAYLELAAAVAVGLGATGRREGSREGPGTRPPEDRTAG